MAFDLEDEGGNLKVSIGDTGVPGYRFEAKIEYWIEGNTHPTFQYFVYGTSKPETLDAAKQWIAEYKAEIR